MFPPPLCLHNGRNIFSKTMISHTFIFICSIFCLVLDSSILRGFRVVKAQCYLNWVTVIKRVSDFEYIHKPIWTLFFWSKHRFGCKHQIVWTAANTIYMINAGGNPSQRGKKHNGQGDIYYYPPPPEGKLAWAKMACLSLGEPSGGGQERMSGLKSLYPFVYCLG